MWDVTCWVLSCEAQTKKEGGLCAPRKWGVKMRYILQKINLAYWKWKGVYPKSPSHSPGSAPKYPKYSKDIL